jgi:hypothetical protein
MGPPSFALENVVTAVFERASEIASGTVTKVASVIFLLIVGLHVVEGAAEIAARQPCRFYDHRFWLRFVLVLSVFAGYKPIVIGVGMAHMPTQMLSYALTWKDVWSQEWNAIDELRRNQGENKKLNEMEMEKKNQSNAGGGFMNGIGDALRGAVVWAVDGMVAGVAMVISVVVGIGLTLLLLVQAFWVLGHLLLYVAVGPICVVFALHPATASVFWRFFWEIFVYEYMYMPFLGIACTFAGVFMGKVSSMVVASDIAFGDGAEIGVHLLMAVLGPMMAYATVKAAPGALLKLFGGGDGGGVGGQMAQRVGQRLVAAGKAVGTMALGAMGGPAGAAGAGAAAAAGAIADGGGGGGRPTQTPGDAARGAA